MKNALTWAEAGMRQTHCITGAESNKMVYKNNENVNDITMI